MENKSDQQVLIIGGGGHAKACLEIISSRPGSKILGYLDFEPSAQMEKLGIQYLGPDEKSKAYIEKAIFVNCIGHIGDHRLREKINHLYATFGASFGQFISPNAFVSTHVEIGDGTIVMHHATIQVDAKIGQHCIINDHALIEHDCQIGQNVHVSTGALVNGNVQIGNNSFIGSGAVIKNGVSIGDNVFVGMGSVVTKSIKEGARVFGNPAKIF